jgi:hypothetical protein
VDYDPDHFNRQQATPVGKKLQHGAFSQQQADQGYPGIEKQDTRQSQLPLDWQ